MYPKAGMEEQGNCDNGNHQCQMEMLSKSETVLSVICYICQGN